ncbi:hypothetical protein [Stenotrophomonas sp. NRRL B-14846]|uniref:hypothetical protein n=1 Tax=Stenotrophomonas sp. NRRL B-14846 TaxID=3162882 RepID=UPI003D2CB87F
MSWPRIGAWELGPGPPGWAATPTRSIACSAAARPRPAVGTASTSCWCRPTPATATQTEQLLAELCCGEPVQVDVLLPLLSMDGGH